VAIIGLGSRGLSVLERIVTLARRAGPDAGQVRVDIIDPSCAGSGVHHPGQPDYLLLNTTCSQVSMFPDSCTVGAEAGEPGPSLYAWVTERGLRLAADGCTVGETGRPIRPTDFLPRRVLSEYLAWFLWQLRAAAPGHVQLVMHPATALDIGSEPGGGLVIALSDGTAVQARHAFLTTGYTQNTSHDAGAAHPDGGLRAGPGSERTIAEPYPLPEQVAKVAPGQRVAISGFGLSAMDLMSCLTVGRGGRFVEQGGRLSYRPSGREPVLLMYSRSGVPCRARPLVVEFGPAYQPLVLTRAGIDALRSSRAGPLDFDADVLPLVLTEMRIAYRRCQARCAGDDAVRALHRELRPDAGAARLTAVLDELDQRLGRFDPGLAFDGSAGMALDDSVAYQDWLADYLARDLAEGLLGFAGSPVKAALDILRELRDTIRYVVDFGGLTSDSLDEFTRQTVPMMNRAVVGPQYERHSELLALMAAGIALVPFGPAPAVAWNEQAGRWTIASSMLGAPYRADADWIAAGHVPLPAVGSSASPLISELHRKGWIREYQPASRRVHGIDVDPDQHPLDASGRADRRLWVLGPLCEGATFYNNLVPSPNVYSRPVFDAHRCVTAMFAAGQGARLRQGAERAPELPVP
jgi:uncharacterized NAD(P)/FAD-binding protein YdhS